MITRHCDYGSERACNGPFLHGRGRAIHHEGIGLSPCGLARIILCMAALPGLAAHGQPPPGYYDPAAGLTGQALLEALNGIISGHSVLQNSALWAAFEFTDAKDDGSVWDMYSDIPFGTPAYTYQFVEDQCGTYDSEGDCFNREHSFPQSWYGSAAPMSTDLFHLYPVDAWVNQQRGNWPYGKVNNPEWTSTNGSKRGPCAWPDCSGTVFEPIDTYKGDLARSYFYMLTRYLPLLDQWSCPMMSAGELSDWAVSLLLSWHMSDPVSTKEFDRNNAVYSIQQNRNPYIDQPDLVFAIWGPEASVNSSSMQAPSVRYIDDRLIIDLAGTISWAHAHLIDGSGRIVVRKPLIQGRNELVLDIAPGVYIAVIDTKDQRIASRFVR